MESFPVSITRCHLGLSCGHGNQSRTRQWYQVYGNGNSDEANDTHAEDQETLAWDSSDYSLPQVQGILGDAGVQKEKVD